jgi:bacterioferritin-associated ferredoxin
MPVFPARHHQRSTTNDSRALTIAPRSPIIPPMGWDFRAPGTRVCVCFNVTNTDALALWQAGHAGLAELNRRLLCGSNCGLCQPYFLDLWSEYTRGLWPREGDARDGEALLADEGGTRSLFDG